MSWHSNPDVLAAYRGGWLDAAQASSVEAHLLGCADCRAGVAADFDTARIERMWSIVLDRVDVPRPRPVQRLLTRCGIAPHTARLVSAVPAARLAWLFGVAVTMLIAAGLAGAEGRSTALLLVLAPLVPLAAVGLSFSRPADPAYEITLTAALPALRLLLLRSTAVVVASLVTAALATLAVPGLGWEATGWLLPGLALTCASLALGSWLPLHVAVAIAAASWTAAVGAVLVHADARTGAGLPAQLLSADIQLGCAVLAALALTVVVRRRDAFESLNLRRTVS